MLFCLKVRLHFTMLPVMLRGVHKGHFWLRILSKACNAGLMQAGTWTAVLDLAGEAYQAFFDSQAAALEALNAAGVGNKPMPLQQAAEVCSAL